MPSAAAATWEIRTVGVVFVPPVLAVHAGDAISLINPQTLGYDSHTFTSVEQCGMSPCFDIFLPIGSIRTYTVDLPPGTHEYVCLFHGVMTGRLEVLAG